MAPIKATVTHFEAREFARTLAKRLSTTDRRYLIVSDPTERAGKIFIDYLRNGRGNTAIGTYSPRARPGFPVAAKVTWKDIENGIPPDAFSIRRPPGGRPTRPKKRATARKK
jgi:bifunctional non-homologous end joining protein LigD